MALYLFLFLITRCSACCFSLGQHHGRTVDPRVRSVTIVSARVRDWPLPRLQHAETRDQGGGNQLRRHLCRVSNVSVWCKG